VAESCGCDPGGIARLKALAEEHGEELEADLLAAPGNLRLRNCPSEDFNWRDLKVFVKFVGVRSHLYRKLFPESADWDLSNQLLASIIDIQRWFQWVRMGADDSGVPPPDPIERPGVSKRKADHRRGNAPRSETNRVLKMRLTDEEDPNRKAKVRKMFRGPNTGPVRDIRGMSKGK
jgi:hypothetical protein